MQLCPENLSSLKHCCSHFLDYDLPDQNAEQGKSGRTRLDSRQSRIADTDYEEEPDEETSVPHQTSSSASKKITFSSYNNRRQQYQLSGSTRQPTWSGKSSLIARTGNGNHQDKYFRQAFTYNSGKRFAFCNSFLKSYETMTRSQVASKIFSRNQTAIYNPYEWLTSSFAKMK